MGGAYLSGTRVGFRWRDASPANRMEIDYDSTLFLAGGLICLVIVKKVPVDPSDYSVHPGVSQVLISPDWMPSSNAE
jgi:hypothetical protein